MSEYESVYPIEQAIADADDPQYVADAYIRWAVTEYPAEVLPDDIRHVLSVADEVEAFRRWPS